MKYFMLFVLILVSTSAFSKIWRVNNVVGVSADFTTAQAAHDGAAATDTIMFEPSATSYGNMIIAKQLVIFGVGFFHAENYANSPITTSSRLTTVTFNNGSQGSLISGMMHDGNIDVNTSDITIKGCRPITTQEINLNSASDIVIARCWYAYPDLTGTCSNILITNNLLAGFDSPTGHAGVTIKNNVITGYFVCTSQTMYNNIYVNGSNPLITSSALTFNIDARVTPSEAFGTADGNFGLVSPTTVFQGGNISGTAFQFTYDAQLQLKVASPAIEAGASDEDCGMFGGAGPYILSGLPPIPVLTKLVSTGIGSNVTPVQITISAKSNN